MRLQGKVALITGGGTGIGREIALTYAREGASIAVNYSRSEKEAMETAEEIRKLGVKALPVKTDVSQDSQVREMVEKVVNELGRIDILVNNAGTTKFCLPDDLEGLTEEMWDSAMAVNVKGTFFCSRAVVPIMKRQGSGAIINTASIAGITGIGSSIAYCASKAGVISITKSLARALAPEIRVNAIAPGFIETRWTAAWAEFRQQHADATPLKRVGQPDDVADVALFLADADFVTGQTIVVDGGRSM